MNDIIQMISSFGFPVVACLGMAYFFKYVFDKNREDVNALNQSYRDEINSIKDALNNNTLVIQQLVDYLKEGGEDEKED